MNSIANIRKLMFALIVAAFFLVTGPIRIPVLIILSCFFLILLIHKPRPTAEENWDNALQRARPKAPFGPLQLYLTGAVFSVYGTAIMAGLNWRRMNQSDNNLATVLLAAVFIVLSGLLLGVLLVSSPIVTNDVALPLITGSISGILFAVVMARWQSSSYYQWIQSHNGTEPTFKDRGGWSILFLILVMSFALQWLYGQTIGQAIAERFIIPLSLSARSSQVYEDSALRLEYPGQWLSFDAETDMRDLCADVDCILALQHHTGQSAILVMRLSSFWDRLLSLEIMAEGSQNNLKNSPSVTRVSQIVNTEVGGQPAVRWDAYFAFPEGNTKRRFVATQQPNGIIIMLWADLPVSGIKPYEDDYEDIIQSITFK